MIKLLTFDNFSAFQPLGSLALISMAWSEITILVKTFRTLCVSGEKNAIQVDSLPYPTSLTVLGVTSQTPFTYLAHVKDLNFVVKVVFMSMYRRLAANFIQNHVKKRRCPKAFWPGL